MFDAIYLVILNCIILFFLVKLSEKKIESKYAKKYGASVCDFNNVLVNFNKLSFAKNPEPCKYSSSVFNDLLLLNSFIKKIYSVLELNKNKAEEISEINDRIISSYIKSLVHLKRLLLDIEKGNFKNSHLFSEALNGIDHVINNISLKTK